MVDFYGSIGCCKKEWAVESYAGGGGGISLLGIGTVTNILLIKLDREMDQSKVESRIKVMGYCCRSKEF